MTTSAKLALSFIVVCGVLPALGLTRCEDLRNAPLSGAIVDFAIPISTGKLALPGAAGSPFLVAAFCRVAATARPTSDSEIHMEIWLPPIQGWNGKFVGTGNGGYSGDLGYPQMVKVLRQGYATAGSDTGHRGAGLQFGSGHPEKINDWAYRAVHVMTEVAMQVIHVYYGHPARYKYFTGCSTGGHQGLSEAQKFPADYDGIVAGAPGNNRVRLNVGFLWNWRALQEADPLPISKLPVLHNAVLKACDALDGIKDGIVSDPRGCHFDPASLQCKGPDQPRCLTSSQVTAVRKIYDGARNPRTGEQLFAGWSKGSESTLNVPIGGWAAYFVGRQRPARLEFWRDWVFNDLTWDPRGFDFDKDVAVADRRMERITAIDPDLSSFQRRGGKIVMYHGWADPVTPPEEGIRYYESVRDAVPGTIDFFRLFMVPGMSHCTGGPGTDLFDALGALDRWVTRGVAPRKIIASHATNGKVDRMRPLCPWPEVAKWKGTGSTDDARQFVCALP
jgi:feruloyl esterase